MEKQRQCIVFNNLEIVNNLLSQNYKLLLVRKNFQRQNELVFIFEPGAYDALQQALKDFGYKA